MPVSQGKLTLGFSTGISVKKGDRSFYIATMLNEILGGSASSKLFLNVREKLSLCYYCSSSFSGYSGVILVSSGFDIKNYEIARKAILEQIEDIKQGHISDTELAAAQRSLSSSYRQIFDSPFELQSYFSTRALFDLEDSIENTTSNLLSVTKEEIIQLASNIKLIASYFVEGTLSAENNEYNEEDEDE
jgi:predicted Zn-dependent peptidase